MKCGNDHCHSRASGEPYARQSQSSDLHPDRYDQYHKPQGYHFAQIIPPLVVYGNCNLRTILMVIVLSVDVFVVKKTASPLGHRLFCNFVILIL